MNAYGRTNNKRDWEAAIAGALAVTLAGCSGLPVVKYDLYDGSKQIAAAQLNDVPTSYELWTTSVEFTKDASKAMSVGIKAAPVSKTPTALSITGDSSFGKATSIKLTTASDSNLLSSVAVNVTDNRASYVTTAGQILGTVLTIAGVALAPQPPGTPPPQLKCGAEQQAPEIMIGNAFDEVVNVLDVLQEAESQGNCGTASGTKFMVGNSTDGVNDIAVITIGAVPPTAVKLDSSTLPVMKDKVKNVFLFPACRQGTVEYFGAGPILVPTPTDTHPTDAGNPSGTHTSNLSSADSHSSGNQKSKLPQNTNAEAPTPSPNIPTPPVPAPSVVRRQVQFLFSDPRYVQAIPLPVSGSLAVKSQCGMTAGTDSGKSDATPDIAKAIADALQSATGKGSQGSAKSTGQTSAGGSKK